MVPFRTGRRSIALAVLCLASAGVCLPQAGHANDGLVWGGRLPSSHEGYVPSASAVDPAPAAPSAALPPPPSGSASESDLIADLLGRLPPAPAVAAPQASVPAAFSPASPAPAAQQADPATIFPPAPVVAPLPPPVPVQSDPVLSTPVQSLAAEPDPAPPAHSAGGPILDAAPPPGLVPVARVSGTELAALPPAPPPLSAPPPAGRGTLSHEAPPGLKPMPEREAMCRSYLREHGVKFVEVDPIRTSGSCGIGLPVKVVEIAPGVAMAPPATLNCGTAARVSKWVRDDVMPAARWKLWTGLRSVRNSSSYRCSRIAGSHTVSEHASGNALDVGGFTFTNGKRIDVEPKGFFSFREKGFQSDVRRAACRYFGTVLGPGYNRAHDDHFHFDSRKRSRPVCK